jgi:hypothetical protein
VDDIADSNWIHRGFDVFSRARYNLGNAVESSALRDEAALSYPGALHVKPDLAGAHMNLGNVRHSRGARGNEPYRIDDAIEQFELVPFPVSEFGV